MGRMFERKDTRKFDIKPRYWDPEKEEREEREKRIKEELGVDKEDKDVYIPNVEGKLRNIYEERKANRRGHNGRYAVRMFLILIAVFLIVLFLLMRHAEGVFRFFGL